MNLISRRRYLQLGSSVVAGSLAGCSGGLLDREDSDDDLRRRLTTLDGNVVGLTYAGVPKRYRQPDEPPEPAPARVHESVTPETYALHETIERVEDALRKW